MTPLRAAVPAGTGIPTENRIIQKKRPPRTGEGALLSVSYSLVLFQVPQNSVNLIDVLDLMGGPDLLRHVHILAFCQLGIDMERHAKAHALGSNDVPGQRVAHIGAGGRIRADLIQGDLENILVRLAIACLLYTSDAADE